MISKERWELTQRYIVALEEVGIHMKVDKENRTISTIIERWNVYNPPLFQLPCQFLFKSFSGVQFDGL